MIKVKNSSVNIENLDPKLYVAYGAILFAYHMIGNKHNCVITSGNDSKHKANSLHYKNLAIDLRVWGLSDSERELVTKSLSECLGKDFDVIDEKDHIHIEYDPE